MPGRSRRIFYPPPRPSPLPHLRLYRAGVAAARGQRLPQILNVNIGRSPDHRYDDKYPQNNLLPKYVRDTTIQHYSQWLAGDSEATQTVAGLRSQTELISGSRQINVIDDNAQTKITLGLTTPILMTQALNGVHRKPVFTSPDPEVEATAQKTANLTSTGEDPITIDLDYLYPDPNWLHGIVNETFSPLITGVSRADRDACLELLTNVVKGKIEEKGQIEPFTPDRIQSLGKRIAEARTQFQNQQGVQLPPVSNPADFLVQKFGVDKLLQLHIDMSKAMFDIGKNQK